MDVQDAPEDLFIGLHGGFRFIVQATAGSAIDEIKELTVLPIIQLRIVPEDTNVTWEDLRRTGIHTGTLTILADQSMDSIAKRFLPGLHLKDMGFCYDMRSRSIAPNNRDSLFIILGHAQLFGETGFVKKPTDSLLRPDIQAQRANERAKRLD